MRAIIYSAVADDSLLRRQGFYTGDADALGDVGYDVCLTRRSWDVIRQRPDLVVAYFYTHSLKAALLGRLVGARVVVTGGADQLVPELRGRIPLLVTRCITVALLLACSQILTTSESDTARIKALALGSRRLRGKVVNTPHYVRLPPMVEAPRTPPSGALRLLTVCWMGSDANVVRKGVYTAVRLVAKLAEIGVDSRLTIVGTIGPASSQVRALAEQMAVSDAVTLTGAIDDEALDREYQANHVYVQLSQYEGFGLAAVEALAAGLIVVHSGEGGLRDNIGDLGVTVDPATVEHWTEAETRSFVDRVRRFGVSPDALARHLDRYGLHARGRALAGSEL